VGSSVNHPIRTALITGGSRGIGLAIARELAESGKHVVLVARDEEKLKREVLNLRQSGKLASYVAVDFFDSNYLVSINNYLESNALHPTILVNGLGGGFGSQNFDSVERYQEIMNLNFFVAVNLTQYLSKFAFSASFGRFLFLGTLAINQMSASAPYVAAKSALISYMKIMAKTFAEINENFLVAAISPGAINVAGKYLNKLQLSDKEGLDAFLKLNRVSAGRLGSPEEVAKVAAFLCGEENNYLHGCNIEMDGGASN
jgi:3-oxoacyl-[acyl-carrier protein] reductase